MFVSMYPLFYAADEIQICSVVDLFAAYILRWSIEASFFGYFLSGFFGYFLCCLLCDGFFGRFFSGFLDYLFSDFFCGGFFCCLLCYLFGALFDCFFGHGFVDAGLR